jgi:hypothetical protein
MTAAKKQKNRGNLPRSMVLPTAKSTKDDMLLSRKIGGAVVDGRALCVGGQARAFANIEF